MIHVGQAGSLVIAVRMSSDAATAETSMGVLTKIKCGGWNGRLVRTEFQFGMRTDSRDECT